MHCVETVDMTVSDYELLYERSRNLLSLRCVLLYNFLPDQHTNITVTMGLVLLEVKLPI